MTSTASTPGSGRYCNERMEPGAEWAPRIGVRERRDDQRQSRPADRGIADLRTGFAWPLRRRPAGVAGGPLAAQWARTTRSDRSSRAQRAAGGAPFHPPLAEELRD